MTPERLFEIRVQRSSARACKTVEAGPVFEAVDELLAEVTRLRPMEAALTAARDLAKALERVTVRVVHVLDADASEGAPLTTDPAANAALDRLVTFVREQAEVLESPATRAALDGGA